MTSLSLIDIQWFYLIFLVYQVSKYYTDLNELTPKPIEDKRFIHVIFLKTSHGFTGALSSLFFCCCGPLAGTRVFCKGYQYAMAGTYKKIKAPVPNDAICLKLPILATDEVMADLDELVGVRARYDCLTVGVILLSFVIFSWARFLEPLLAPFSQAITCVTVLKGFCEKYRIPCTSISPSAFYREICTYN